MRVQIFLHYTSRFLFCLSTFPFFGSWNKESVHSKVDNKENKMSLLCDSPYMIDVYIEN